MTLAYLHDATVSETVADEIPDECPAGGAHRVLVELAAYNVPRSMGGQSIEVRTCEACCEQLGTGRVLP